MSPRVKVGDPVLFYPNQATAAQNARVTATHTETGHIDLVTSPTIRHTQGLKMQNVPYGDQPDPMAPFYRLLDD
jgi:hypothetical protein